MKCSKCEREIDDAMKFCPHCGNATSPDGTIEGETPIVAIPPAQRQVDPKARMISRLLGTFITLAILGIVVYRGFFSDPEKQNKRTEFTSSELSSRLEQVFTKVLMGTKPAQVKNLQGHEYGIWLDKTSGEPDIKVTYDPNKNKWLTKGSLNDQNKAIIADIRSRNLSAYITRELGEKPYAIRYVDKAKFAVWMDKQEKADFSMRCNTKEQKWEPDSEEDKAMFKLLKDLK